MFQRSHNGGGIEDYGVLSANNDTFTGNQAGFGGGIFDDGTLTANNDTFTGIKQVVEEASTSPRKAPSPPRTTRSRESSRG